MSTPQHIVHDQSARSNRADDPVPSVLDVSDLRVLFEGDARTVTAVDGVSFSVKKGRTLAIVGESGSGKSVTSLAVMRLLPEHTARISGSINFDGRQLLDETKSAMRSLRGNRLAMIFQEPMTSLNPSYTIGEQINEVILRHRRMSKKEATERAIAMLRLVRIPSPETRYHQYPHNLSGGMRQRVMIAMALACDPELLIADEPTTALDVTIQAQVLELMRELQQKTGAATILITHDLGVVAESCDDVIVMYAGQVVEQCSVEELFTFPQHPYTVGLLGSLPRLDEKQERLVAITGTVPDMANPPSGCRFQARCPFRIEKCATMPELREVSQGHFSRCWRAPMEDIVP
ncbi:ABC transporter ATP-binding protein [Sinorhizobium meliloti]|uniref:Dipeptide ABC transporter ATP-binding protein DppD n=1 Tax=Rhizobium meliloti TaxID=382 RepID=A0A2J0YT90_RHIML|nr:ABC transporter ATP-binding protein [Sinorhizobium meliloti]PJR09097.1 dipeptide ABC transporter ATP-binding protein DppD [Sinorhizobium meliloti]